MAVSGCFTLALTLSAQNIPQNEEENAFNTNSMSHNMDT